MTQSIQLVIDGTGAGPAAAELRTLPGLTITTDHNLPTDATRNLDLLTVTANVVTIASGLAVAELLRQWYLEWRQGKANRTIDKVLIIAGDQRLLLENMSKEQLAKILETL
ncbi:MAG: hypothetical protein NT075_25705 [Chloroflexi bacterium]|nr:hypothetical protein [Chloroflexota bacterium]